MEGWTRGFAILLVALLVGIVLTPHVASDSTPTISVSVNGDHVADGERVVVPDGNLSVDISSEQTLSSVVVRIDDEDVVVAAPNETSYTNTLEAPFSARWNDVEVIVKAETGELWTQQLSVYKDTLRPDIGLERPFTVDSGHRFPTETAETSADVTVRGTVRDRSNITAFSATVIGGGQSVETTTLSDGDFSLNTTLVPGNNSLVIKATDEYGHRTYRTTRIKVTDESDPALTIHDWPAKTELETITPRVIATDAVAVRSVTYQIPGQPSRTLVEPTTKLLDAGRTNITKSPVLKFDRPGTYSVTFNVTDYADRWTEVTKSIEYDPVTPAERVTPDIRVDESRSGLVNESRYHLAASVENGSVARVFVESAHRWEGVTFFETLYEGSNVSRYTINETVTIEPGHNEITVKVTDALGTEHTEVLTVDTENASRYDPPTTRPPETSSDSTGTEPAGIEGDTKTEPTTAGQTRISVTEQTPIAPKTDATAPLSPLLVSVSIAVAGFVVFRRVES